MNFFLPDQFWRAYQSRLYRVICQQRVYLPLKKIETIRQLAALRRFDINEPRLMIDKLLNQHQSDKWFKIIIKELTPIYPEIIFEYLQNHFNELPNQSWLSQIYFALSLYHGYLKHELIAELDKDEYLLFLSNLTNNHQEKYAFFNEYLQHFALSPLLIGSNFGLEDFEFLPTNKIKSQHQVTILVTAFNATKTIVACLRSLLNQSWQNIQVIVIDDNSSDETVQRVKSIQDMRLMLISLPKNIGTFAAKSIGAMYATGEFMTCQDSDDIAHPDKIKEQVEPLIQNADLVVSKSYWLRIDRKGDYYARQYCPLLRQNPASPLFRRQKVQSEIGLWHIARTGADSEFFERLKLAYGDELISVKKPLTFAKHSKDSLMNSNDYGVHNKVSALNRLDYWESWRLWHMQMLAQKQLPRMPNIQEQLDAQIFDVPDKLVVNADDIKHNLANLTIFGKVT